MGASTRFVAWGFAVGMVVVALACGGGATSGGAGSSDDAGSNAFFGEAGTTCATDSDCPAGQSCRPVRIGELSQNVCVADPLPGDDAAAADDAAAPLLDDGGAGDFDAWNPDIDASILFQDAAAGDGGDGGSDSGISVCSKNLKVTISTSGPLATCVYNTTATAGQGKLSYQCAGGVAAAVFGSETFTGTLTGTTLSVKNVHTYDFHAQNVLCNYTVTETITGNPASGTLQYSYAEKLSAGQPAFCKLTVACYESGPVSVN